MKFICTQENINQGLARATPLAGRNAQLPILENALLGARDGVLHVTCTDLEVGIHTTIPGKIEQEGSCTVPARRLFEYVQQLPTTNPLTLELVGTRLHVTTTGFEAQFPTTPDDDFPLLPTPPSSTGTSIKGPEFCQALTQTIFAAARDETRPEIHSVYLAGGEKRITIAATDSFRLAERVIPWEEAAEQALNLLLPLSTAQEVVRLFSDAALLHFTPHDNHLTITGGPSKLSSRLIEGKYPNYQQIIPQSSTTSGTIDRVALIRALKTLTVFLPRDSRRVELQIKPRQHTIALQVAGHDSGQGNVALEFSGEGPNTTIIFNIQYLLEGVQHMDGPTIQLQCTGSTDPVVLRPHHADATPADHDAYTYVVMPIQT